MITKEVEMKQKILEEIEKEMERKGISQAEMGRRVDIARHHINSYFRGKNTSLSFDRIIEMAEVVGLEVDIRTKKKVSKK